MADSNQQFLNQLESMGGGKTKGEPAPQEGKIQYTCHPIQRYRIGKRYEFENGILTLENEEAEKEFLEVINHPKFPLRERQKIRKLDFDAATKISEEFRKQSGGVTKQTDSSIGERPDNSPKVGKGDLIVDSPKPAETEPQGDETSGVESSQGKNLSNLLGKPKE